MTFNYAITNLYLSKIRAEFGVKPPAVTQIITKTNITFDKFMEKLEAGFDFETEQAKFRSFMSQSSAVRRGRKVAHALENGKKSEDKNVNRVLKEMKKAMRGFNVVEKEASLHYKDIYWGKADLVGFHKGVLVIADNKSVTKELTRGKDGEVVKSKYKGYGMQVAAYANAHNKMFGTKIDKGVLFFSEGDGSGDMTSTIIEVNVKEYLPMFCERVRDFYLRESIMRNRESAFFKRRLSFR
jgi:hypothetical protein